MPELANISKLLHVAIAFWFVGGLLGRTLAQRQARRSEEIRAVDALCSLAGAFDRLLVIPGAQLVLVVGIVTALLQGYPLLGFLQGAQSNWLLVSLVLYVGITALVPTVFLPKGRTFDAALTKAREAGKVTGELSAALHDRRTAWAHRGELAAVAAIIVLMVLKPF